MDRLYKLKISNMGNKQILINYSKVANEETKAVNETLCINATILKKVTTDVPADFVNELEILIKKYFE